MSQATPIIGSGKPGLTYRTEDNDGKKALLNHHKGSSAPSYAEAGILWLDDAATPWILKSYDGTDWIKVGDIHATNNDFTPYLGTTQLGKANFTVTTSGSPTLKASSTDVSTGDKAKIIFDSKNASSTNISFATLVGESATVTAGAEDGVLKIQTVRAGTDAARIKVGAGLYTSGVSDPGTDAIAAKKVQAGVSLTDNTSLADDAATSFTPEVTSGFIFVHTQNGNANNRLMAQFCTTGTALMSSISIGTVYNATTGTLAGTTGTDTKITVSAHTDGKIYIENRSGSTAVIKYTIIG